MKKALRSITILFVLFLLFSSQAEAANFILIPASSAVYQGSGISVYLQVNSTDQPSNSYTAVVSFDGNYLTPLSVSKAGSICTLFVAEPSISASTANVTCGLPSPGFNGASGNIITMNFRAKKVGTTYLGISGGAILANDGYGTNILRQSNGTSLRIIAAQQTTEEPTEEVDIGEPKITADKGESGDWLKTDTIKFTWEMPENAEGFSYILTQDKNKNPEKKNATSDLSKTYSDLEDGIYYFKIYATDGDNYSDLVTYEVKIDNTGPEQFDVVLEPKQDGLYETLPLIGFAAVDNGSGVDRYEMKIDDGQFTEATNPYVFTQLAGGTHTVVLRAYDQVGNYTEKEITFGVIEYAAPVIISPSQNEIIQTKDGLIISGTGEPNASILLYIDGELIGVAQTNGEGRFNFSMSDQLIPGPHELTARVKNEGGILGTESLPVSFTIEETLVAVGSLDFLKENIMYVGLCGGSLLIFAILLLIILLFKRRKDEEEEEENVETKLSEAPVATKDIEKEREIERRLNDARREIDDELDELERELREKVEENPGRDPEIEHKLEREISDAIEDSETKIEKLLDPEKIIDDKPLDLGTPETSNGETKEKAIDDTIVENKLPEKEPVSITPNESHEEEVEPTNPVKTPSQVDTEKSPGVEKINNEILEPEGSTPTYTLGEDTVINKQVSQTNQSDQENEPTPPKEPIKL